jgi:hypothetical protein
MEHAKKILIQYAQADFSKRLNLYLQFPGLRDAFQELERAIVSCPMGFPLFICTERHGEMFCATLIPQLNQRNIEMLKVRMDCCG